MAEPIEMPFVLLTRVDPRNHVLNEGTDGRGKLDGVERAYATAR